MYHLVFYTQEKGFDIPDYIAAVLSNCITGSNGKLRAVNYEIGPPNTGIKTDGEKYTAIVFASDDENARNLFLMACDRINDRSNAGSARVFKIKGYQQIST